MRGQPLMVKESKERVHLIKDLHAQTHRKVKSLGKTIQWLQFARMTKSGGYRFLPEKEAQWEVLNEIGEKVSSIYPMFRQGKIVDMLSEMVNTTVHNSLWLHMIPVQRQVYRDEKDHLKKQLIHLVSHELYIPRHHWLKPIKEKHVLDIVGGVMFEVTREETKEHYYYHLLPTI